MSMKSGKAPGYDDISMYVIKNTFEVIDQTRGRVFPSISKHREVDWKNEAQPSFF